MRILKIMKHLITFCFILVCAQFIYAQENSLADKTQSSDSSSFTMSGEYRINPLYSRGFREPLKNGEEPGTYVLQRSRLTGKYEKKKYTAFLMIQDLRIWGEPSATRDPFKLGFYRAWVNLNLSENLNLQIGRNELKYDDQYLFGARNWAGNLAHDGAILKFKNDSSKIKAHLILAYNAQTGEFSRQPYTLNHYKALQTLWFHKDSKNGKFSTSWYIINRALEDSTMSLKQHQTIGTNTKFKFGNFVLKGIYYHQLGKNVLNNNVSAFLACLTLKHQVNERLSYEVGTDIGSGTDISNTSNTSSTFDRMFGLLHGQFGYLDLFYVRRPATEGIEDYFLKATWKTKKKLSIVNHIHWFQTNKSYIDNVKALGLENDFLLKYRFSKDVNIAAGYSIFFRGNRFNDYWGAEIKDTQMLYGVIVVSPTFFKRKN